MAGADYSPWEVVLGMGAYAAVGVGAGFIVNAAMPQFDPTVTDGELALRVVGQYASGAFLLTEAMRALMPKRDTWSPPCSDASALIGLYASSCRANSACKELLSRYDKSAREQLGLDISPPAVTSEAAIDGAGREARPVDNNNA